MKIIGRKIDQHILKQQEKMDNQAGFTRGGQIDRGQFVYTTILYRPKLQEKEAIDSDLFGL